MGAFWKEAGNHQGLEHFAGAWAPASIMRTLRRKRASKKTAKDFCSAKTLWSAAYGRWRVGSVRDGAAARIVAL
eukprot:733475-Pyramimonas_sp.AAC.1